MLPEYILFPIASAFGLYLVFIFAAFRGYRQHAQFEGEFEARWLKEIERQRRHLFLPFRGFIRYPIAPLTPTKIQQYVAEVQSYLKWSHWAQRLLWFAIGTSVLIMQLYYGTIVADLDRRYLLDLEYSVEHAPPYAPSDVRSIEEAFNAQLELKAEFDQIEAQAAEQGWTIEFNAPYQEAALQARKDELAFNALVLPMVQDIEQELGITIDPPYGRDIESIPLMLKTGRIPKGTVPLWDGTLGTIQRSFDIMAFEVSQLLYQQYIKRNPSARQCATCPVERVSWKDAVVFANALSKAQNLQECYQIQDTSVSWTMGTACTGWRLPTELEWVFAARGGQKNPLALSQRGAMIPEDYSSIGSKAPNAFGTYDQLGNVAEWVWGFNAVPPIESYALRTMSVNLSRSEPLEMIFCGGSARRASSTIDFNTRRPEYWFNVGDGLGFRLVKTVPLETLLLTDE